MSDENKTVQESLGLSGESDDQSLQSAIAKGSPFARRVTHKDTLPKRNAEQQNLLASIILSAPDAFGSRSRSRQISLRLAEDVQVRLDRLLASVERAEKTRVVEFALDRLLRDLGY